MKSLDDAENISPYPAMSEMAEIFDVAERATSRDDTLWAGAKDNTLSAKIVHQVCTALFAGRLTPGQPLGTEASLADHFDVSRTAIRDSLRSLAAAGVIDIKVGLRGGIFVAEGNPERLAETLAIQLKLIGIDTEEIMDAQIAIEVTAAGLAAARATTDDVAALKAEIDAMETLLKAPDVFTKASLGFHASVVAVSRNRVLIAQFQALRHVLTPLYRRGTTPGVAQRAVAAHRALVVCIKAHDVDGARALLYRRLQFVRAHQIKSELTRSKKTGSRMVHVRSRK